MFPFQICAPYPRASAHPHPQFNYKPYGLGRYEVEADAAAARDLVAKVLRFRLNFKKPRKITGQRSKGADQKVADAVKAANAFMLGNYNGVWGVGKRATKILSI